MTTVYKCMKVNVDGCMGSVVIQGKASIYYEIGKWSVSKPNLSAMGYHPLAFDTLQNAIAFYPENICECEGEGQVELPGYLDNVQAVAGGLNPIISIYQQWPKGTVMYRKIEPLRMMGPGFAYKLVLKINGMLLSCATQPEACVEYGTSWWVDAPLPLRKLGYNLLVFDTLANASKWRRIRKDATIYLCEYGKTMPLPRQMLRSPGGAMREGRVLKDNLSYTPWPDGTMMVDSVRLVEEIK
jgi:hypothetical protein